MIFLYFENQKIKIMFCGFEIFLLFLLNELKNSIFCILFILFFVLFALNKNNQQVNAGKIQDF